MTKRKQYHLRNGDIIEVEEYPEGKYGAPGTARSKRKKPTAEQMQAVNAANKAKRCRHRMIQYIKPGDIWATWTYRPENRPADMQEALQDFRKAMRKVRKEYKKQGRELFWFRNIERGTKGAWHIHLVINEIGGTASILEKAWSKGGTWFTEIRKSKFYDEDFSQLAKYLTKDEHTVQKKSDGTMSKPRLKEASYSTSRNMPLPEPEVDKLIRWQKDPKPKKGYYIAKIYEGINPLGLKYRRYTMIRLGRDENIAAIPKKRRRKRKGRREHESKICNQK